MEKTRPTQIDPTKNVIELVNASIKRLDDISAARDRYIDEKIRDKDTQYQLQFASAKEAVGIALVAQEKAVAAALEGTREAINKADINTDKRFSLLSEKIDGITSTISKNSGERGIYVTHTDLNIAMDKLQTSIEATLRPVVTFMNAQTGGKSEVKNVWGYIIGVVGLVATVLAITSRFN